MLPPRRLREGARAPQPDPGPRRGVGPASRGRGQMGVPAGGAPGRQGASRGGAIGALTGAWALAAGVGALNAAAALADGLT